MCIENISQNGCESKFQTLAVTVSVCLCSNRDSTTQFDTKVPVSQRDDPSRHFSIYENVAHYNRKAERC